MRKLHKHLLIFDEAFSFFVETLERTNTFSEEALKVISPDAGIFFTLLPDTANLAGLYDFSSSILPPEPKKTGPIGNLSGLQTYSPVLSLEKEFAAFLHDLIHLHAYQFMSDDFNATFREKQTHEWFNQTGAHYLEEVYYFLSPQNATPRFIEQCLQYSKTFWHSLCILSNDIGKMEKMLQLSAIQKFCKSAQLILVGAYDGDGYLIWQRNESIQVPEKQ